MSLKKYMKDNGTEASDLDSIVHDAANAMASNANNGGRDEQIEFLTVIAGWTDEEIIEALKRG